MRVMGSALCAGAALAMACPAQAQETGDWTVEGYVGAVSDYRFRGVSLTERDPALQAEATVSASSGFYAYGWASSIRYGDDIELMGAVGWSGALAEGLTIDAGGGVYLYPGVSDAEIFELYASAAQAVGPATVNVGVSYYPEQDSLGGADNFYAQLGFSTPLGVADAQALGSIGWEDGAFGDDKVDWSLGVAVPLEPLELRLTYVGSNLDGVNDAEDAAVAELRYKFIF